MTKQEQQHEAQVVEAMAHANELSNSLFGAKANVYGTLEIFDYIANSDDPEDFGKDLERTFGHAKTAFKTETPTPEQVFGLFERIFLADEE